jgi:hypothetical protein
MFLALAIAPLAVSASERITVHGYLPDAFASEHTRLLFTPTSDSPALHLFELPLYDLAPPGLTRVCEFEARLPSTYQLLRASSPGPSVVSISPDLPAAYSISEALLSHGFTTVFFPADSAYVVRPFSPDTPPNYTAIPISKSELKFLLTAKSTFVLFAPSLSPIAARVCHIAPRYSLHFFVSFALVCALLALWVFARGRPRVFLTSEAKFWILDGEKQIRFGPPPDSIDPIDWRYVLKCVSAAHAKRENASSLIRLFRGDEFHQFQRAAAFPMRNGLVFAVLWLEKLPESADPQLGKNFEFSYSGILGGPQLTFSSFRDFRPVHMAFTLDNFVRCVADLPASIIAPFQPYGETVTVLLAIFEGLAAESTRGTFAELFSRCCATLGLSRCFVFQRADRLIVEYTKDGIQPFPPEKVMTIPQVFPI